MRERKVFKVSSHSIYKEGELSRKGLSSPSILQLVASLKTKTDLLKDLRLIQNELISNSGYHEKNMEKQIGQLEKVNAPIVEIDLLKESYEIRKIYTDSLWKDFKIILNKLKSDVSFDENKIKIASKQTLEELKNEYWTKFNTKMLENCKNDNTA